MTLILRLFTDILTLPGRFEFSIQEKEPVPNNILELWKSRGYNPVAVGLAKVNFGNGRTYLYPAYFWGE